MRRADRLFQIIQILRRTRKPLTADAIAAELETSKRTVYRDIATLMGQRVPIRGEAGIGYVLEGGFDLPPLMLTPDEIEAAVLGAQWVMNRGGSGRWPGRRAIWSPRSAPRCRSACANSSWSPPAPRSTTGNRRPDALDMPTAARLDPRRAEDRAALCGRGRARERPHHLAGHGRLLRCGAHPHCLVRIATGFPHRSAPTGCWRRSS